MTDDIETLLDRISTARPANEAEVETKILLHLFRILGYTDDDRADKPAIGMQFGRERKWKHPDFVLYQGVDRSVGAALVTVEAKAPIEELADAEFQAQSYAPWAGTPYYLVSNGKTIKAVQFLPGAAEFRTVEFPVSGIRDHWQELVDFLGRGTAILTKERLSYTSLYLPEVEQLPPQEFFREYLLRVESRFQVATASTFPALSVPDIGISRVPHIPVSVRLDQPGPVTDLAPENVVAGLLARPMRLVVSGAAGSGKSTLCKRVAGQLAASGLSGTPVLPVYILLSRAVPTDPVGAFRMACEEMGIRFYDQLFKRPLSQARFVLILDGLDEIEITDFTSQLLSNLIWEPSIYSAVVASRPIGLEGVGNLLDQGTFERAHIRDLSDAEIGQLFARYVDDRGSALGVLQSVPTDVRDMLRLPLFALMAIRVSQTHAQWQTLSKYCLFELYVGVLNEYFGTPTVRGGAVGLEELLTCLVEVAVILQRNGRNGVSLAELRHAMDKLGVTAPFRALLNTGLLMTAQGKASFAHRSFLEFGLARGMLQAIHDAEQTRFGRIPATDGTYELVRGEIDDKEEKVLLGWAASGTANRTRTRAIHILRERAGPEVVGTLVGVLKSKAPSKVWTAALRALLRNDQPRLVKALPHALNADRTRNRRLARTLRSNGASTGVISSIATALKATNGVGATEGLVKIVTHFNLVDHAVHAASAFAAQPVHVRRWMARKFYAPRGGEALLAFVDHQLMHETDPEVLFSLLFAARSLLLDLSVPGLEAAIDRIEVLRLTKGEDLKNAEKLRNKAVRETRSVAIAKLVVTIDHVTGRRMPRSE